MNYDEMRQVIVIEQVDEPRAGTHRARIQLQVDELREQVTKGIEDAEEE
jgi:hypothetical protein